MYSINHELSTNFASSYVALNTAPQILQDIFSSCRNQHVSTPQPAASVPLNADLTRDSKGPSPETTEYGYNFYQHKHIWRNFTEIMPIKVPSRCRSVIKICLWNAKDLNLQRKGEGKKFDFFCENYRLWDIRPCIQEQAFRLPWRCRQYVPLKCRYKSTGLQTYPMQLPIDSE